MENKVVINVGDVFKNKKSVKFGINEIIKVIHIPPVAFQKIEYKNTVYGLQYYFVFIKTEREDTYEERYDAVLSIQFSEDYEKLKV